MNLQKLKDLRENFEHGDEMALVACVHEFAKEQDEYYPLWCLASSARQLNPLIIDMEQNDLLYNAEIDEAYRTMVRNIIESLDARIEAHEKHEPFFKLYKDAFYCRRCHEKVGWLHPDLKDRFMFSSNSEGNEAEGICYECWAKDHPNDEED